MLSGLMYALFQFGSFHVLLLKVAEAEVEVIFLKKAYYIFCWDKKEEKSLPLFLKYFSGNMEGG